MLALNIFLFLLILDTSSAEDTPCPVTDPLSADTVCGPEQERTCYSAGAARDIEVLIAFTNLCESSLCPVSQLNPVIAMRGDMLSLSFSEEPFFRLPLGLSVYSFPTEQGFITCDVTTDYQQLIVSESDVLNATLSSSSLPSGISYLSFSTDISCLYLRMVVNVQEVDCAPESDGSAVLCSGVGVCAAPSDPFSERGYSCVCPQREGAGYRDTYCADLDECSPNPCQNGGVCSEQEECGFTCECTGDYTGTFCETEIQIRDVCEFNLCTNVSQCVAENDTSYRCVCPPGVTGQFCDQRVNNCLPNPCLNSGICANLIDGYSCSCLLGFTGPQCGGLINYCDHSLCMAGECNNITGGYFCVCPPSGRVHSTCGCYSGLCTNGGECSDVTGYAVCSCPTGFSGDLCETDLDLCQMENPCSAFGSCQETTDRMSTYCVCAATHTGATCSTPLDPCFGVTCSSRGDCISSGDGYTCVCLPGYSGDSCGVLDPCSSSPCANSSVCVNATDTGEEFRCVCPAGVTGRTCDTPITCEMLPCNNGTCRTDPDSGEIACICPLGRGGVYCEREVDIVTPRFKEEQSYLAYSAPYLGESSELRIRFRAARPDGVVLFGSQHPTAVGDYILVSIDEGFVSVLFDCGSGEEFVRVTEQRLDDDIYHILDISIDACRVELSVNSWHSLAVTAPGPSTVIDIGQTLYIGGVPDLVNLPAGANRTGLNGCVSSVEVGEFSVPLHSPVEGSNVDNCEENVCQGVYCSNGGRCVHSTSQTGYSCICPDGSEMESCGLAACLDNPCMHGGKCLMNAGQAVCACQPFFTGILCEQKAVIPVPFFSGSQHSSVEYGLRDQELVSLSLTVRPNASALSGVLLYTSEREYGLGDYLLLALSGGYPVLQWDLGSGQGLLSSSIQLLADNWYQIQVTRLGNAASLAVGDNPPVWGNSSGPFRVLGTGSLLYLGGVASLSFISPLAAAVGINGFIGCIAEFDAFSGQESSVLTSIESGSGVSVCQEDPCVPNVCQNGASCVSIMGGVSCVCPDGYTGQYCSSLLGREECSSQECDEGATCIVTNSGPQCLCPLGRTGDRCGQNILITYPSFTKSPFAYLRYSIEGLDESSNVSLQFSTQTRYGQILFSSQLAGERPGDFLSLSVFDGKLELRWNLGSGVGILRWPESLVLSQWYQVEVRRAARWSELSVRLVSSSSPVSAIRGYSQGTLTSLNLNGLLYVGGADSYVRTAASSGVAAGLNGCVRGLVVNGMSYTHAGATAGVDVESCSLHPCTSHACAAGSSCEASPDYSTFRCECPIPQAGDLCDITISFESATFSGNSYAEYSGRESNQVTTRIEFEFRVSGSEGLVAWVGREGADRNGDYLSIGVRGSGIHGSIDLGSGATSWEFSSNISDHRWHNFSLFHDNMNLSLSLDSEMQTHMLAGDSSQFNPTGGVWVGGHRELAMTGFSSGLNGCISGLKLSGQNVDLDYPGDVISSRNVLSCDS